MVSRNSSFVIFHQYRKQYSKTRIPNTLIINSDIKPIRVAGPYSSAYLKGASVKHKRSNNQSIIQFGINIETSFEHLTSKSLFSWNMMHVGIQC